MSIMVGLKFLRVRTDLKQTLDTFLRLVSTLGQRVVQEWSKQIECKKASLCWSVWVDWSIGSHDAREPPTDLNNAALPLLSGPHLPALISISMSASCSQYVITILPGFLALSANLKLHRLCFVRIQLVKRSGTKEAASLWTLCQVEEITGELMQIISLKSYNELN